MPWRPVAWWTRAIAPAPLAGCCRLASSESCECSECPGLRVECDGGAADGTSLGLSDVVARRRRPARGVNAERPGRGSHLQHGDRAYAEWRHRCIRHPTPPNLVLDIFSYFAPIAPLSITTTSLPSGTLNYNYSTDVGGDGRRYSLHLEHSLRQLAARVESGREHGCDLRHADDEWEAIRSPCRSPTRNRRRQPRRAPLSITVNATPHAVEHCDHVATVRAHRTQTYSAMLAATGGITPYTWSLTGGSLPVGLSLNSSTGAITGTPTGRASQLYRAGHRLRDRRR